MKKILMKIITVLLGTLILCFVLKYFFKIDLWNIVFVPLIRFVVNFFKALFN